MRNRRASAIAMLLSGVVILAVGCRRPAYQDLYVQNMSAEIRELEDIIYEYDHEYRKLELELEQLDRENQFLKQQQMNLRGKSDRGTQERSAQEGSAPSKLKSVTPKSEIKSEATDENAIGTGKSWQGRDAGQGAVNQEKSGTEKSGTEKSNAEKSDKGRKSSKTDELELPPITIPDEPPAGMESKVPADKPQEKSILPDAGSGEEQSTPLNKLESSTGSEPPALRLPPASANPSQAPKDLPSLLPPPVTSQSQPGKLIPDNSPNELPKPTLLEPPSIDLGQPATGPSGASGEIPGKIELPKKPANEKSLELLPPPGNGAMEIELGRLPKLSTNKANNKNQASVGAGSGVKSMPSGEGGVITASALVPVERSAMSLSSDFVRPLDQRMTEIAFVRPFSVSLDLDGEPGDDGIRLVLQPRNAAGEFLEQPATLTVSAIDPDLRDDSARLGIWKFTSQQVEESMRRVGVAKGIHLDLSLSTKMPSAKRVVIFVRYETADGRRLEASHEYYLSAPGELEAKWLPRAGSRVADAEQEKVIER